jgi:hypothetical protein
MSDPEAFPVRQLAEGDVADFLGGLIDDRGTGVALGKLARVPAGAVEQLALDVFNPRFALAKVGGKYVVLDKSMPGLDLLLTSHWQSEWAGLRVLAVSPDGKTKPLSLAKLWFGLPGAATISEFVFWPNEAQPGGTVWNTAGLFVLPQEGETPFFDRLMAEAFAPDDADTLLDVVADVVQDPRDGVRQSLAIWGRCGAGKSLLAHYVGAMLGTLFAPNLQASMIRDRFDSPLILLGHVEADQLSKRDVDAFKLAIFTTRQWIEYRRLDPITIPNLLHLIFTSEHPPLWLGDADMRKRVRRLAMKRSPRLDQAFWEGFFQEMETVGPACLLFKLLNRPYDKWKLRHAHTADLARESVGNGQLAKPGREPAGSRP